MPTLLAQKEFGGHITGIGPLGLEALGLPFGVSEVLVIFSKLLSNLIGFLTVIAGIYFIFQFIFGAYEWITAGGDTQKLQHAQKKMLHGIIGLIIVIATVFIVDLIGAFLGLDILNPAQTIADFWT